VLAGLGTPTKQFSSCVLIRSDDDLDSIFASGEMMAKYASKRAGIGLEVGRLRPLGSPIRNGEILHTGLVPFLKKWFGDLRSCSQGGIRNASATITYPIWHYQFDDLIVLKNNQGTEETRVRHLDYNVVLSSLFWNRFKNRKNITFFDPNEVPDLYESFYSDIKTFDKLYEEYELRTDLKKKVMSAEEVFKGGILKERTDTGRIYLTFIDNVQNQGPFDTELDPIYQSNLCCLTGDIQVEFMHSNGQIEKMSLESAVDRWEIGALTNSKVKSYDGDKVTWKSVSAAVKTKTVTELYEIEDEYGNIIRCTGDHLIFTKNRGYVRADELVEIDVLCHEV
jgi:ribonucleotide reductase alpha subunit